MGEASREGKFGTGRCGREWNQTSLHQHCPEGVIPARGEGRAFERLSRRGEGVSLTGKNERGEEIVRFFCSAQCQPRFL